MPRVYKRPAARRDLVEHYVHLAESDGEETADRFLRQADVTFALLKFLIFYLPRPDGCRAVSVPRVFQLIVFTALAETTTRRPS
jgi:hypothetical protein